MGVAGHSEAPSSLIAYLHVFRARFIAWPRHPEGIRVDPVATDARPFSLGISAQVRIHRDRKRILEGESALTSKYSREFFPYVDILHTCPSTDLIQAGEEREGVRPADDQAVNVIVVLSANQSTQH